MTKVVLGKFSFAKGSDLGKSFRTGRSVGDLIAERVPITLLLNLIAVPLIYIVAIGVGVTAATNRDSRFDVSTNMTMLGFWSVPTMLTGVLLIGFFSSKQYWHWFPTAGLNEREAADMPFLPHWQLVNDVALMVASVVICTLLALALARSEKSGLRRVVLALLGFSFGWWMISAAPNALGWLFTILLCLFTTVVSLVMASVDSRRVRLMLFGFLGIACGVAVGAFFSQGIFTRGFLFDRAWHLVLPIICLSYGGFAFLSRLTRSAVLENLLSDYVRTARAKGVGEDTILWHHVFRNSLLPLITVSASLLPGLLAGSVIVESIFSIDGMGKLAVEAVQGRDRELVLSITLVSGILTLLGYLIADICYSMADPRVSYE